MNEDFEAKKPDYNKWCPHLCSHCPLNDNGFCQLYNVGLEPILHIYRYKNYECSHGWFRCDDCIQDWGPNRLAPPDSEILGF